MPAYFLGEALGLAAFLAMAFLGLAAALGFAACRFEPGAARVGAGRA